MNKPIARFIESYFNPALDLRVRLFHVLAMGGTGISFLVTVLAVVNHAGFANIAFSLICTALSYSLLAYSRRSGRYQVCYMVSIAAIFFVLFPLFFFTAGGYYSGMPSFFVFAVMFTVFMLEGKNAILFSAAELLVYITICLAAYRHPGTVRAFADESEVLADIIIGFTSVSVILGVCMFLHFRLYNEQQRKLENARAEALRLSEAKGNFLANMSHEIRTPINVMLGMNEMILRESDSERVKSYGMNMQNAGRTLLLLINNILDVSKIESGKLAVSEESYRTADLINDLSLAGTELAGRYGLRFLVESDENLPHALTGDFLHIKQVIGNFLSNAAKYTRQGSVKLSFAGKPSECLDEIILRVAVADTGVGIKQENLALLFDAFTRVDMASNRGVEGTGLGLAIARELAELMGGRVHVESVWGRGSVFALEVPQKISDDALPGEGPPLAQKNEKRIGRFIAPGASVLVVDDNRENLQVIRSLLSRTMLRVDTAGGGAECLEAVKNTRYDVILMDYMMPDMDGIAVLEQLKAIEGFDTPAIALTANVVAGVREKLLESGFKEYLSKPVMWRDLEAALLASLPEELVTVSAARGDVLSAQQEDELARELVRYGVELSEGLRYVSGDIAQYKKLAGFFIENYERGEAEIRGLARLKDWERVRFSVHSLKSRARAVGAASLSATAAKMESLCERESNDGAYIEVMLPVLRHEWELARDGLAAFSGRIAALLPDEERPEPALAGLEELSALFALLKHNRGPDALDALDRLIAAAGTPEAGERLREIRKKVDDVEFRDAEKLLTAFMGDETDG